MKKYIKCGFAISFVTLLVTGCSSATSSVQSHVSKKAEVASTSPESSNIPQGNVEYAFTQAGQHPEKVLVKEIDSATSTLDIAIYSITQPDIVNSIIKAEDRGVKVRIITDKQEAESKTQKEVIGKLKAANIPIKDNTHSGLMHLKVSIIDDKTVTTGSFNYTTAASKINDEVLAILHDKKSADDFEQQFNRMWEDTKDFANL